jgi:hypothetical protein
MVRHVGRARRKRVCVIPHTMTSMQDRAQANPEELLRVSASMPHKGGRRVTALTLRQRGLIKKRMRLKLCCDRADSQSDVALRHDVRTNAS